MSTVGWMLIVAVGIALGFSLGRMWPGQAAKLAELQRERDGAREDLANYRGEVSAHFERTAELFDKVTADYRSLYEHLSLSARQLGAIRGESERVPLAEPERRQLAAAESAAASATTDASEAEPAPTAPRDWADPEVEPEGETGETPQKTTGKKAEDGDVGLRSEQSDEASPVAPEHDPGPEDDSDLRRKPGEELAETGPEQADEPKDEASDKTQAEEDDGQRREPEEEKPGR